MKNESVLLNASIEFAVCVIEYYKWLTTEKNEYVMSRQLLKSGTSIGANIHEAYYAVSKPDFIAKMQIALKEASETEYWLTILERTGFADMRFESLKAQNLSLKRMLIATLKTSKSAVQ